MRRSARPGGRKYYIKPQPPNLSYFIDDYSRTRQPSLQAPASIHWSAVCLMMDGIWPTVEAILLKHLDYYYYIENAWPSGDNLTSTACFHLKLSSCVWVWARFSDLSLCQACPRVWYRSRVLLGVEHDAYWEYIHIWDDTNAESS
jgi:hypothetical protein